MPEPEIEIDRIVGTVGDLIDLVDGRLTDAANKIRALRPSTDVTDTSPEMLARLAYRRGINDALDVLLSEIRQSPGLRDGGDAS